LARFIHGPFHPVNIWLAKVTRKLPSSIRIYTYSFSIVFLVNHRPVNDQQAKATLGTCRTVLTVLALACAVLGLAFCFAPVPRWLKAGLLAIWLVGPPIWFWFEYHIFNRHLTEEEKKGLKEYQDVSSKVWAGVAATLALVYFGQSGHGE
jgi:hypothetical protein